MDEVRGLLNIPAMTGDGHTNIAANRDTTAHED